MFKFAEVLQNMPGGNFSFKLGKLEFAPSYFTAVAVVILLFVLIITLAQVRRHFLDWSVKGAVFGLFFGFVIALILEGFLIIGGRTAVTEILGWENAPKPILTALDLGRGKLVDVLGVSDEVPSTFAQSKIGKDKVIEYFKNLSSEEAKEVKSAICEP